MIDKNLLINYLLTEASGLVRVLGITGVADDAAIIAKFGKGQRTIKILSDYLENVIDLETKLKTAGHSIPDFSVLKAEIQAVVDGSASTTDAAEALIKMKSVRQAIETEANAGRMQKLGSLQSGGGGGGGRGSRGGRTPPTPPTPAEAFTKELQKAKQLEDLGQKSAARAIREQASAKYGFPLDEELKSIDEYIKEIDIKRKAGLNSEASRLEAEMFAKHGGTKWERLKLWIRTNKAKAALIGLSAVALAYLGYTAVSSLTGGSGGGDTPTPGGGGGRGRGGGICHGGSTPKECGDLSWGCGGRSGPTSERVRQAQQKLIDCGYPLPKFGVDGLFCTETKTATKNFQRDKGISSTGVVDGVTLDALNKCNIKKPEPTPEPREPGADSPTPAPKEKIETFSESLQRKRYNEVEKLVFERLVKGCK